jgi:hypothetical protein
VVLIHQDPRLRGWEGSRYRLEHGRLLSESRAHPSLR